MRIGLRSPNAERLRRLGIVSGVALAHLGLFLLMSPVKPPPPLVNRPPPFLVTLVRPVPPPPPPPPPSPSRSAGGGAPAAPSRIHIPPKPVVRPPELPAPPIQAPEPALVIGIAPIASPTPGLGQGGEGTGTGEGTGSGDGPGSGGAGPRLVRGPSRGEIGREYPPAARAARRSGRGVVSCEIRLDTRLEGCRVVSEDPPGFGFGEAALRAAAYFRFTPPTTGDGRPRGGQRVTFGVEF